MSRILGARRPRLIVWLTVVAIALIGPFAGSAFAHETDQPYAYLFVTETTIDGRLELSIRDIGSVLGVDVSGDDIEVEAALREAEVQVIDYASDHFSIGVDGERWDVRFSGIDLFRESSSLAFAVVRYDVAVPGGVVPTDLIIRFDPFFDEIDGQDGLLLIGGGWTQTVFDPDAEALVAFDAGSAEQRIQLGDRTQWQNFGSGITLGVDHIKTGPDHIMFVLALLLPAVLVFLDGQWHPTSGFLASLWRVLKIATFFTIAHSITFTFAGMGWLPQPPSKLVESIIAASIAAAALHNLHPLFPNREWALSFVFGLFHGMGFASLVASLDVSRSSQLISLLGRNVGIEIGQVVVIVVLFPALYLLRRTTAYRPLLMIGSVVLAALSGSWMIERVFELDLGTDSVVDEVVRVPRVFVIIAGLTVAAAAIRWEHRRRDALLPAAVA